MTGWPLLRAWALAWLSAALAACAVPRSSRVVIGAAVATARSDHRPPTRGSRIGGEKPRRDTGIREGDRVDSNS
jgi:hypothetical protein